MNIFEIEFVTLHLRKMEKFGTLVVHNYNSKLIICKNEKCGKTTKY